MTDAHFYIYNVGHGVCTLLTGKKGNGDPYCGVFDCGTKAQHDLCDIKSVIEDMKEKIQGIGAHRIDDVVFSHQDEDHWNKFLWLFSSLNDVEKITLLEKTILLGKKGEKVWKVENNSGGDVLFTIEDQLYIKERQTNDYKYTAEVQYNENGLSTMRATIIAKDEPELEFSYNRDTEYCISLNLSGEWGDLEMDGRIKKIDVNNVTNSVLKCVSGKNTHSALREIMSSFSKFTLKALNDDFNSDNVIDIEYPINRVIMGGNEITLGYSIFKSFLWGVHKMFGGDCFIWEKDGAYITLTEDSVEIKSRDFPNQALRGTPSNLSILRNLTSVVVEFNIDEENVLLLPGDITVHALREIANIASSIPENSLKLFLAPHHGSDNSNLCFNSHQVLIDTQPLLELFDIIPACQKECNLVISGYNKRRPHPGVLFVELASTYFTNGGSETSHSYAHAVGLVGFTFWLTTQEIEKRIESKIRIMPYHTKRIFTTNCLAAGEKYYDYYSGSVTGETIPLPQRTRKLPPDNVFIKI